MCFSLHPQIAVEPAGIDLQNYNSSDPSLLSLIAHLPSTPEQDKVAWMSSLEACLEARVKNSQANFAKIIDHRTENLASTSHQLRETVGTEQTQCVSYAASS